MSSPKALWRTESFLAGFLQCVLFSVIAAHRLVDRDEGFYLMAAKLVAQGQTLYHDFAFSQMPLTAYLYGYWMAFTSVSWESGRLLSGLLTGILGGLIYGQVGRLTGKRSLAILAVLLFSSCSFTVGWMVLIKTYAVSNLLLFGAYCLLWKDSWKYHRLASGFLFALSIDARLLMAAVLPVFLYATRREKQWMGWLLGCGLGLSLNLVLLLKNPQNFWFNNLGFHAMRTTGGLVGGFDQKLSVLSKMLAIQGADGSMSIQLLVMGLCTVLLAACSPSREYRVAIFSILALAGVSVLPTPTFSQYFSTLIPFLVLCTVGLIDRCQKSADVVSQALGRVMIGAGLVCVLVGGIDLAHYCGISTPWQTYGAELNQAWKISGVQEVSRSINRHSQPGDVVYASWPGYLIETYTVPLPGTEMDYPRFLGLGLRMSAEQRTRYHILSKPETLQQIREGKTTMVVNGIGRGEGDETMAMHQMLLNTGYQFAESVGQCGIYVRSR
ncbi:MAG TPA: hypothetical protein EYO33_20200 [Phycisphaerales bacterium]|nr:hypothetical protein [Phycisphaerales bacterium]